MSHSQTEHDDAVIFSLSDLGLLCRRFRQKILLLTLCFTLLSLFYTLSRPVVYEAKATFREKEKSQAGLSGSLSSMLGFSSGRSDLEAISLMQSRKLMTPIVQEMGLQAVVSKKGKGRTLFSTVRDNLKAELGHFRRSQVPVLPELSAEVLCDGVVFESETPLVLQVTFLDNDFFQVTGLGGEPVKGEIDQPFSFDKGRFVLRPATEVSLTGQTYTLSLLPLHSVAEAFAESVTVQPDEDDPSLLRLEFAHPDRHFSARFLNKVMENYKSYLVAQNDERAETQLAYLKRRQGESDRDLHELLSRHAASLSTGVFQTGFTDSDREMEFLAHTQQRNKQRMMGIELELKRIAGVLASGEVLYDKIAVDGLPDGLSAILGDIRFLQQKRDSTELALRQIDSGDEWQLREGFALQLEELEEIGLQLQEARLIQSHLSKGLPIPRELSLARNPTFLVGEWLERLDDRNSLVAQLGEGEPPSQAEGTRDHFAAYLDNLTRTLSVQQKTIEERLAHQQNPHLAYQGVDLVTAEQLHVAHQQELSSLEAQIRQNLEVFEQMQEPGFDVTSLNPTLQDPISLEMMQQASLIEMQLRDSSNRTEKEQKRLQDSLNLYHEFLASHLRQQTHLLKLRQQLMREKSESLMRTMLDLINREVTILEKHVHDQVLNRQGSLDQELALLDDDQRELRQRMAQLPSRWVAEQMIEMRMSHNQLTLEEVSKLVESKNISHNLEVIESAPVDIAIAPILPRKPRLFLIFALGTTIGLFFSTAFVILRAIGTGVPVSAENLRLSGQHVSGRLSSLSPDTPTQNISSRNLEALRQVTNFLSVNPSAQRVLLANSTGPSYVHHLATLLAKKGKRSLVVDASFDRAAPPEEQPGLLQLLERKVEAPLVIEEEGWDRIAAGGISRYSAELLGSVAFDLQLKDWGKEYDYLFLVTNSVSHHAEALLLLERSQAAIVTVESERLNELRPYTHLEQKKPVTFLVHGS